MRADDLTREQARAFILLNQSFADNNGATGMLGYRFAMFGVCLTALCVVVSPRLARGQPLARASVGTYACGNSSLCDTKSNNAENPMAVLVDARSFSGGAMSSGMVRIDRGSIQEAFGAFDDHGSSLSSSLT